MAVVDQCFKIALENDEPHGRTKHTENLGHIYGLKMALGTNLSRTEAKDFQEDSSVVMKSSEDSKINIKKHEAV